MAINKKLIHFKNKQNFETEVANNNILDNSIVFIQDSKEISTHGTIYKSVNWSVLEETVESGSFNGHEYVDLGLPSGTLWATCNVGAKSPEEYGDYFAWGETSTKSIYNSENSITEGLSISELEALGIIDVNGNLTAAYDAVAVNWGGAWRMPTDEEATELINNCIWELTTVNEVDGMLITGTNSNSIFIPNSSIYNAGSIGFVGGQTSTCVEGYKNTMAHCLSLDSLLQYERCYGVVVRGVINLNN